jgi:endo-beta-N-acetylglucosaminidase D
MRTKQFLLIILLMGTAGLVQGCGLELLLVGAGAAGTIAYVRGDLEAVESEKLDVLYEATLKAVEKLELSVTTKSKDAMSAMVVVRDAQDKKITIKLKAVTEEATKLYIRVGIFGSETKSRLIYQEIHESLRR